MSDIYGAHGPSMSLGNQREGKATKESVRYRLGDPHCDVCAYWHETDEDKCEGTCDKVEGLIRGDDLCDLFLRAGHAKHEEEETSEDK